MRTLISRYSSNRQTRALVIVGAALIALTAVVGASISAKRMGSSPSIPSLGSLIVPSRSTYDSTAPREMLAAAAPAPMADQVSFARPTAGNSARQLAQVSPAADASYWASQKLIRSANLRILVKDVKRAVSMADSIGGRHGAMLSGSSITGDGESSHNAELQFRIPTDRFSETVAALRSIGDVRGESMNAQDVTKDYADLETRLGVKTETVTRLRNLLATHTAKLVDVLQVEEQLARAVTELEQLKGERRFYDQQIALSSLSVTLFEQVAVPPRAHFTDPLVAACRHALEVLGGSLAAVVYGLVFVLPWVLLATLMWWIFNLLRPRATLSHPTGIDRA